MALVILTEEESMGVTLRALLPRLALGANDYRIVPFQGVSDLESSLIRRVRAWSDPMARFLVIRDNDGGNCALRKKRLLDLLAQAGGTRPAKVRIVMQELEAWFLGDPVALELAGILTPGRRHANLARPPESHARPVDLLKRLYPGYGKVSGAARIAPYLDIERNTAACFHATIRAVRQLVAQGGDNP